MLVDGVSVTLPDKGIAPVTATAEHNGEDKRVVLRRTAPVRDA